MSTEFYLDSDDQDHIERYTLQDIANLFGEMDELKEELAARDATNAKLREALRALVNACFQSHTDTIMNSAEAARALLAEGEAK
jgi:hypothetical protein